MKTPLTYGLSTGLISGTAGSVYSYCYQEYMFLDYSQVITPWSIITASVVACLLMAGSYWYLGGEKQLHLLKLLNICFALLTCFSVLLPLGITLPLDVEFPEMFPGLAVPLHFFPTLIFFSLLPYFQETG